MSEQLVDGHNCNAWCRPAEGLHAATDTLYSGRYDTLAEYIEAFNRGTATQTTTGDYVIARVEPAPEAKPHTLREVNADLRKWGEKPYPLNARLLGAVVFWFRVPVEAVR